VRITGASAITGFDADVDWLDSTIIELVLFSSLQDCTFRKDSLNKLKTQIFRKHRKVCHDLGFHMIVKK